MARAFIFPGQGSQSVGMGKALSEASVAAREVFEEIDEVLKQNLSHLMFEGPEEELRLTENTQPALFAHSMAVMAALTREAGFDISQKLSFVAGHSLGEYSALAAAGSMTMGDGARLLKCRGSAMQSAVPVGEGAMAAILGLDLDTVENVVKTASETGICAVANDNAPGQVVVSGEKAAVEHAADLASEKGAKRSILLPVSAPFHCPLMAPAASVMAKALGEIEFKTPAVPLLANITALAVNDPQMIKDLLVEQVTGRVRWRESMEALVNLEVTEIVEIGTGRVLSGLMKRINRDVAAHAIGTPEDIEQFLRN